MTPKLVSVTRVLNEDDIIEAFVRHNAAQLDFMMFLDNGSTDNTLPILLALKEEGLPITVCATGSLIFDEVATNTSLYMQASWTHLADWVVFLDADEFLSVDGHLAERLSGHRKDAAIGLKLLHYFQTAKDNEDEPIIPVRQRWRHIGATGVTKILLRGGLPGVEIEAGNHGARRYGDIVRAPEDPAVALAHYPERNVFQALRKAVIGWLKVLAAGQPAAEAGWSKHYAGPFNQLRDAPAALLRNSRYLQPPVNRNIMADAPLAYLGGHLRYTSFSDPAMQAVRLLLDYVNQLARRYGEILAASDEARQLHRTWDAHDTARFTCHEAAFKRLLEARGELPDHLDGNGYYSAATDPALKALMRCLRYAELLARRHGRLLDELPELRRLVQDSNAAWTFVL
jgi:hypothetical protein